jgi:hypothetical protein
MSFSKVKRVITNTTINESGHEQPSLATIMLHPVKTPHQEKVLSGILRIMPRYQEAQGKKITTCTYRGTYSPKANTRLQYSTILNRQPIK